jgi:hypothetical protein
MKTLSFMRTHSFAGLAVALFLFAPVSASAQVRIEPGGVTVGPGYEDRGGGGECARWRHQCATEGRRCDRVENFCGGMGRGSARGAGRAECRELRFECETQGRRCGRYRDLC